jgi:hypothetical protein
MRAAAPEEALLLFSTFCTKLARGSHAKANRERAEYPCLSAC